MKKTIRLSESELHRIVKEGVRKILKEEYEPYDWDGLDDDRKEFEKHLSWRNKEEVDANDKAITNPLSYMNKQDSDRVGQMIQANRTSKPGAKMSWDWGYKSGRGVDDPTDVKTVSDFEKAEDEFVNPYDSKYWHDYPLRDEFWEGIPESRTLNKKSTIKLSESDLHRIVKRAINEALSDEHFPSSDGHPDIYTNGVMRGNRYKLNYGADYGRKRDSSLLKNGVLNPNAKRTEWMWIKDMVNHANDLFKEYHLHDQDAYDAIEKLNELLKQGVQTSDAVDQIGDDFYKED